MVYILVLLLDCHRPVPVHHDCIYITTAYLKHEFTLYIKLILFLFNYQVCVGTSPSNKSHLDRFLDIFGCLLMSTFFVCNTTIFSNISHKEKIIRPI